MTATTTRLAPSPTGALHLGNARTFLLNALMARQAGWRMMMRVEDLDGPRVKAEATERTLDDLAWLGLTWEQPVVYQSDRSAVYDVALQRLIDAGAVYPCVCTRKDIETAASAPHAEDGAVSYPGTCRGRYESAEAAVAASGRPAAWRFRVPDEPMVVADRFAGEFTINVAARGGDFVVFNNRGAAAYQLAVTVDDADAGVDAVVRGHDLLDSAARQMLIRRALGLAPEPAYWHLPLVVGTDGRRLAKRHGDTRVSTYRLRGARPERLLGLLGHISGLCDDGPKEMSMAELAERFDPARIPPEEVVLTGELEAFLDA